MTGDKDYDLVEDIKEAKEDFINELKNKRKCLKWELIHLERHVDQLGEVYHQTLQSFINVKREYNEIDRMLTDFDGRKLKVIPKIKEKKVKKLEPQLSFETIMSILSQEEKESLARQLQCMVSNEDPMDEPEQESLKQAEEGENYHTRNE